jgi:hypothetical protein
MKPLQKKKKKKKKPQSGRPRCDHGSGATCLHCKDQAVSGKGIEWLCRHGPGSKCVNCIKVTKKWKAKKRACRHPANMRCAECTGGGDGSDSDDGGGGGGGGDGKSAAGGGGDAATSTGPPASTIPGHTLTAECRHPATGMCERCLPKTEEEKRGVRPALPPKCRNHGPHGSCINCLEWREARKHRVKSQAKPNTRAVSLARGAARVFQQQLQDTAFTHHRCGHMYGRVTPKGTRVDAIYEPPQVGSDTGFRLAAEDPWLEAADAVAAALGMERVGLVFSHPRRDGDDAKLPMSGVELSTAARAHAAAPPKSDKGFVIVTIRPDHEGKSSFEAFQLSDQVVEMQRQGIIADPDAQAAGGKLGKLLVSEPVFVEGAETREADVHFFVCPTAILDHKAGFLTAFPVENRPTQVTMAHLRSHLVNHESLPFVGCLRDFHLLLYLAHHLDVKTDMPHLCTAVKDGDAEACAGFQLIIESLSAMG